MRSQRQERLNRGNGRAFQDRHEEQLQKTEDRRRQVHPLPPRPGDGGDAQVGQDAPQGEEPGEKRLVGAGPSFGRRDRQHLQGRKPPHPGSQAGDDPAGDPPPQDRADDRHRAPDAHAGIAQKLGAADPQFIDDHPRGELHDRVRPEERAHQDRDLGVRNPVERHELAEHRRDVHHDDPEVESGHQREDDLDIHHPFPAAF